MKHDWKGSRRWWTRVLSIIPISGNTKTCRRCGAKLRTTKAPSTRRRGTFTSRYEYWEPGMGFFNPTRTVPPCRALPTSGAAVP